MGWLFLSQGSLKEGTFGAWSPVANEMELCDVAVALDGDSEEEDEEEDAVVEVEYGPRAEEGEPMEDVEVLL